MLFERLFAADGFVAFLALVVAINGSRGVVDPGGLRVGSGLAVAGYGFHVLFPHFLLHQDFVFCSK